MPDLKDPIDDVEHIQHILEQEFTFEKENIKVIKNGSRSEIISGFEQLITATKEVDKLIILYAGHGKIDAAREGFWMPIDATNESVSNWISNEIIKKLLRDIPAQKILVISDACFSGSILRRRNPEVNYAQSIQKKTRMAITSGALESVPDHSVFIRYLAKYLQESEDNIITAAEIFAYLQEPVKANSPDQNDSSYGHIRESGHEGGDFYFVRKKQKGSKQKESDD